MSFNMMASYGGIFRQTHLRRQRAQDRFGLVKLIEKCMPKQYPSVGTVEACTSRVATVSPVSQVPPKGGEGALALESHRVDEVCGHQEASRGPWGQWRLHKGHGRALVPVVRVGGEEVWIWSRLLPLSVSVSLLSPPTRLPIQPPPIHTFSTFRPSNCSILIHSALAPALDASHQASLPSSMSRLCWPWRPDARRRLLTARPHHLKKFSWPFHVCQTAPAEEPIRRERDPLRHPFAAGSG